MKRIKTTMTTILLCLIGCLSFPITAKADDTLIQWSKSTYSGGNKDLYSAGFAWNYYDNITVVMNGSDDPNDNITVTLEDMEGNVLKTICNRVYHSFSGSINPMTFASSGSVRIHAHANNVDYTTTTISGHRNSHTHSYTLTNDANYHWYICSGCSGIKDKAAHTWGSWTTTKAATCTVAGTKTRKCTVCGRTETVAIAATGHKSYTLYTDNCT